MRKGRLMASLVGLVAVAALGACADSTRRDALLDPTPAEMGPATTHAQINNGIARTWDTNTRLFWDDMGRFWLFDRPSHMTPYPIRP